MRWTYWLLVGAIGLSHTDTVHSQLRDKSVSQTNCHIGASALRGVFVAIVRQQSFLEFSSSFGFDPRDASFRISGYAGYSPTANDSRSGMIYSILSTLFMSSPLKSDGRIAISLNCGYSTFQKDGLGWRVGAGGGAIFDRRNDASRIVPAINLEMSATYVLIHSEDPF